MASTKLLFASTVMLASAAGFSAGWTVRPTEARIVVSEEERYMLLYERDYRLTPEESAALRAVVRDYVEAGRKLVKEFDRKFEGQATAVADEYDLKIRAILTPDKRR